MASFGLGLIFGFNEMRYPYCHLFTPMIMHNESNDKTLTVLAKEIAFSSGELLFFFYMLNRVWKGNSQNGLSLVLVWACYPNASLAAMWHLS